MSPPAARVAGPAALAVFAAHCWLLRGFYVDDAYIGLRYLRQWGAGNGLVFNVGERVEGFSNPLWLAVLTPFERLGADPVLATKGVGFLCGVLVVGLTWRLAASMPLPAIAPLLLAASMPFAAWSIGGLEAPLFALLLIAAVGCYVAEEERAGGWLSALLFALLAATRPEGAIFAAVALALRTHAIWRGGGALDRRDWQRLALFGSIVGVLLILRFAYYGDLLPNTVYAKSMGFHLRGPLEGAVHLHHYVAQNGGWLFFALPAALAILVSPTTPLVRTCVAFLGAYALFFVLAGGDFMEPQRFLAHIFPLLALVVQAGLGVLRALVADATGRRRAMILVTFLVAGQVAFQLAGSIHARAIDELGAGPLVPPIDPQAAWLREHVTSNETVALTNVGLNAYVLPLETRVLDMVGLTDRHIARLTPQFPSGLLGRGDGFGKWDIDYVLAAEPDIVEVHVGARAPDGSFASSYTGNRLLLHDPRFLARYEPARDAPKGLFVRRTLR